MIRNICIFALPLFAGLLFPTEGLAQDLELVKKMRADLDRGAITKGYLAKFKDNPRVGSAISCSGNPKLIIPLLGLLFQDESPEKTRAGAPGDQYSITPISVSAAWTIARLVANSPNFPRPVVQWAARIANSKEKQAGERRQQVRRWCDENKELLVGGKYNETRPPSRTERP